MKSSNGTKQTDIELNKDIKKGDVDMSSVILLLSAILIAALGQLLLKKGMISVGGFSSQNNNLLRYFINAFANPYVLLGLIGYFLGALVWLLVLTRLPLSVAYPCISLGYVIVAISSKFIFQEHISVIRWIGIATICLGVFLISKTI